MKIGITNDHRGVKQKEILTKYLEEQGYDIIDYGTNTEEAVDFPDYAFKLGDAVISNEVDLGVAICGTGIGMSIALNKMKGIYCAKCCSVSDAIMSKAHNDANVIAISEDVSEDILYSMVDKFIETPFSNIGRYINRNDKIKEKENA